MAGKAGAQLRQVDVQSLRYDPKNPRLPSELLGKGQDEVLDFMVREQNVIELMGSIGENGYFPGEPLLVVESETEKGVYVVVEGNRRFTAAKLLLKPELAKSRKNAVRTASADADHRPTSLPCIVFPAREEILDFLGYRHITGIKPWDPLMKARYLRQLRDRTPEITNADLARQIGSRVDHVERLLAGLAAYDEIAENAFFGIKNLSETTLSFSVLTTALNYSNIAEYIGLESGRDVDLKGLNRKRFAELTRWLFEPASEGGKPRVPESRDLRLLNDVVADSRARDLFAGGRATLAEAYRVTGAGEDVFRQLLVEGRDRLQAAISQIHLVEQVEARDLETLKDIGNLVRDLRALVLSRLTEQEEVV